MQFSHATTTFFYSLIEIIQNVKIIDRVLKRRINPIKFKANPFAM